MTSTLRTTRCICGILLRYHRDAKNRQASCDDAQRAHPKASVRKTTLREALFAGRRMS